MNLPRNLEYFLQCYLAADEGSLAEAAQVFVKNESLEHVTLLMYELKTLLEGDVMPLRALIQKEGNHYLPEGESPKDMLTSLYEELQRGCHS